MYIYIYIYIHILLSAIVVVFMSGDLTQAGGRGQKKKIIPRLASGRASSKPICISASWGNQQEEGHKADQNVHRAACTKKIAEQF